MAPQVGLEPTTTRLTAECSAIELLRNACAFALFSSYAFLTLSLLTVLRIGEAFASPIPSPFVSRQRPTLPGRLQPSTISAKRLNFCVRYGNRWIPLAIVTGNLSDASRTLTTAQNKFFDLRIRLPHTLPRFARFSLRFRKRFPRLSPRPISIIKLHTLPHFHR